MERQLVAKPQTPIRAAQPKRQAAETPAPAHPLWNLQHTVGNQALQRLINSQYIQTKLKVSTPGDPLEQEADHVADTVMRMPDPASVQPQSVSPEITPMAQRKSVEDEETTSPESTLQRIPEPVREEEENKTVAPKIDPIETPAADTPVQRRASDEELEKEPQAETIQRQTEEDEEEEVQTKTGIVQRACEKCEEETVHRDYNPGAARATASVAPNLGAFRGSGSPLPPATRAFFEPRFGADFSHVRVHNNGIAADAARSINANAFTFGRDIVFGGGKYAPETHAGRRLLAHELTHTLQQSKSTGSGGVSPSIDSDSSLVQRDPTTPAPASGVTPPSPPPPGATPTTPPPTAPDDGLVYINIDQWTVLEEKKWPLIKIEPWSTEVPLIKIPIPELGSAASVTFRASFSTELNAILGPIKITKLALGMSKLTAVALGGTALLGAAMAPLGPGALGPLAMALKMGYITGWGQLSAPAKVTAKVNAEARLDAVLALLGTEKLDIARTGFGLNGSLEANLTGKAEGATQVTLDNGHLTWKSGARLSAGADMSVNLNAFLEASILFGLFKARLNKKWPIVDEHWAAAATKPVGEMALDYDWPSFKDQDHIITLKEDSIRGVMNFVKDLLEKDQSPGEVTGKEKLSEHKGPDKRTPEEKQAALDEAIKESEAEMTKPDATAACVEGKLPGIKATHRLVSLTLIASGDEFFVEGIINPIKTSPKHPLKTSPAVCAGGPAETDEGTAAELALAQNTFKNDHWVRQQLDDLLKVSASTSNRRINAWRERGQLFALETSPTDPLKAYNFDQSRAGERPLKDTEDNRAKYGFKNPSHTSREGQAILAKGWRPESPPTSDIKSRYDSMSGGKRAQPPSPYVNFERPEAHLGHGPVGASQYWNTVGHKQSFAENKKWNRDPANYWGPEHKKESSASGSSAPRYLVPMKAIGSHEDWLCPIESRPCN